MTMIKYVLIAGLLTTMAWTSDAQDLYLALKGGTHLAGLNFDGSARTDTLDISPRVGWNAAMVACYQPAGSRFGASLELGYLRKGALIDTDSLDYVFHYVGGPILFDYYLTDRIKLSAGPEIAILVDAKNHVDDERMDITSDFGNQFELGGTLGASFSPSFFMDIGVRYNFAFTDIADADLGSPDDDFRGTEARNISTNYIQLFLLLKIAN